MNAADSRLCSSATEKQKRAFFTLEVKRLCSQLMPAFYRQKIDESTVQALVEILTQGTVMEIIRELREVQRITENNLYESRSQTVAQQEQRRREILARRQPAFGYNVPGLPSSSSIVQQSYPMNGMDTDALELRRFEDACREELRRTDMQIILELDRLAADQQATLERAGLPRFWLTNQSDDLRMQMYVLDVLERTAVSLA